MDNYLTTLSTNISECKDNYKGFEDVHATDNGTNSYGVAIDIFKKKSVEIHAQNLVCIRALDNAYDIVKTERDLAQSIYEKYVSAVAEDERIEREKKEEKEKEEKEEKERKEKEKEKESEGSENE